MARGRSICCAGGVTLVKNPSPNMSSRSGEKIATAFPDPPNALVKFSRPCLMLASITRLTLFSCPGIPWWTEYAPAICRKRGLRTIKEKAQTSNSSKSGCETGVATNRLVSEVSKGGPHRSSSLSHFKTRWKLPSALSKSFSKELSQTDSSPGTLLIRMVCPSLNAPNLLGSDLVDVPSGRSLVTPPSLSAQYPDSVSGHQ